MNQMDAVVEMLSENRAGYKLKRMSIKHSLDIKNHSLITFVFESDKEDEERHIGIFGEDLQVSFGTVG